MFFFSWLFRKKKRRRVAVPVAPAHDTIRPVLAALADVLEESGIASAFVTTQSTVGDFLVALDDEHYARNVVVELSKRLGCWVEPADTLISIAQRRRW